MASGFLRQLIGKNEYMLLIQIIPNLITLDELGQNEHNFHFSIRAF